MVLARSLRAAGLTAAAVVFSAVFTAPVATAQASAAVQADPVWHCATGSNWNYPSSGLEIRTRLCLGETLGRLSPTLTTECKAKDWLGYWVRTECSAKDLKWRLTAPGGTQYNGTMPDGTGYYWDTAGTTDVPCSTGKWTFEMASTHVFKRERTYTADTSQTENIDVTSCS